MSTRSNSATAKELVAEEARWSPEGAGTPPLLGEPRRRRTRPSDPRSPIPGSNGLSSAHLHNPRLRCRSTDHPWTTVNTTGTETQPLPRSVRSVTKGASARPRAKAKRASARPVAKRRPVRHRERPIVEKTRANSNPAGSCWSAGHCVGPRLPRRRSHRSRGYRLCRSTR